MRKLTQADFTDKVQRVYGAGRYDVSNAVFITTRNRVCVKCCVCSHVWNPLAVNFLAGYGCPVCGAAVAADCQKVSTEEFIVKALAALGDNYDFSKTEYVNSTTPVTVKCKTHAAEFKTTPADFLRGRSRCMYCTESGFRVNKPASLYVLSSQDGLTKVGITNRTAENRARNVSSSKNEVFAVDNEFRFAEGGTALDIETVLLRELRSTHVQPTEKFDGYTECFYNVDHEWLLSRIDELIKEHTNGNNRSIDSNREITL